MNKTQYIDRLLLASNHARRFAMTLDYVTEILPTQFCYSLFVGLDPVDPINNDEEIKILGGRMLKRSSLMKLSPSRAGDLLWVDGKVPTWVNLCPIDINNNLLEFEVMFSKSLLPADPENLPPDYGMPPGNDIAPFRIRGPSERDWAKVAKNV